MKLCRYGSPGQEKPGMIDGAGYIRDLSSHIEDLSGEALADTVLDRLSKLRSFDLPLVDGSVRFGPVVRNPSKFIAIGLNYHDHAKEAGMPVPQEPVIFLKAPSCISGANDDIQRPRRSERLDWEVELGIVIGKTARYVTPSEAASHIAGYCVVNDVSERGFQLRSPQWDKGKGCDSFGPIGPWLVTRDEIPDAQNLDLWLDVNGKRMQAGTTKEMIFDCNAIVSYCSQFMALLPGDIITTGTPPGVGMGFKPNPIYLNDGDIITLGISGLGQQTQRVRPAC